MKLTAMIMSIIGMLLSSGVFAATIRVPSEQPTIQAGIDAAVDGDIVLVADGTYTYLNNQAISFNGKLIQLKSENGPELCLIDCADPLGSVVSWCSFTNNENEFATLDGFTIFDMHTATDGGGIRCIDSSPTIINCNFINNYVTDGGSGGAIYCLRSSPTIENCLVLENVSETGDGAGIYCIESSPTITNCIFLGNYTIFGGVGGGICAVDSSGNITNCTFANNQTSNLPGGGISSLRSNLIVTNCIFWGDKGSEIDSDTVLNVSFSDIQGGYPGDGNVSVNPIFMEEDPLNIHLHPSSPCVDTGTSEGAPNTDFDNNPRPSGKGFDMGAFEFSWPSKTQTYVSMPSRSFRTGDSASCKTVFWNADTSTLSGYSLFTILDVFGSYYFAPSFSDFDYFKWSFPPGLTELTVLPEFTWPDNVGTVTGIVWYAFLMNPEMTEMVGGVGVFDFGWSE